MPPGFLNPSSRGQIGGLQLTGDLCVRLGRLPAIQPLKLEVNFVARCVIKNQDDRRAMRRHGHVPG